MQVADILYVNIKQAWCSDMRNPWKVARANCMSLIYLRLQSPQLLLDAHPQHAWWHQQGTLKPRCIMILQTDAKEFIVCPSMHSIGEVRFTNASSVATFVMSVIILSSARSKLLVVQYKRLFNSLFHHLYTKLGVTAVLVR